MSWRDSPELMRAGWLARVPPNRFIDIDVDATAQVHDFAALAGTDQWGTALSGATALDLRGKTLWLEAVTENITILRGDHVTGVTGIVAGGGFMIKFGEPPQEMWMPRDIGVAAASKLTVICGGANKKLRVFYDND